jgi:hypothetical protein
MVRPFPGLRKISGLLASVILASSLALAVPARAASQQAEFDKGQQFYANGQHIQADDFFRKAIDSVTPTITEPNLVSKGRMIIAASDMYLGRKADAIAQFELILKANAKFEPDPIAFPPGVLEEFRKTRDRLETEAIAKAAGDKTTKDLLACRADLSRVEARYESLKTYAGDERLVTKRSRIVASLPFGIGQFQNGDTGLGILFLTTEVAAVAAATIAFGVHESIPRQPADVDKARSAETTSKIVNWVGVGAFILLAAGGITQAHLAFVPETYDMRKRTLPPQFLKLEPLVAPNMNGATFGLSGAF